MIAQHAHSAGPGQIRKAMLGIVKSVKKQHPGRLLLCCVREEVEVTLFEAPVMIRSRSPLDQLRGFVQRTIAAFEMPRRPVLAHFLHLPERVVKLVLDDLEATGAAVSDSAGCWSVPEGAPRLGSAGAPGAVEELRRRLLCYWRSADVLLPVLPSVLRQRDLVRLDIHPMREEIRDAYERIRAWDGEEAAQHGKPDWLTILPQPEDQPTPNSIASADSGPFPGPRLGEILASRCRLDLIVLSWAVRNGVVWEIHSRVWSRPRFPDGEGAAARFASGEMFDGLAVLEKVLLQDRPDADAEGSIKRLSSVFDSRREAWRDLFARESDGSRVDRNLYGEPEDCAFLNPDAGEGSPPWSLLDSTLGEQSFIPCRNREVR